ncbi:MAG: ornithine cyclodeaminase family protein [Acidobacteriota bacterium]
MKPVDILFLSQEHVKNLDLPNDLLTQAIENALVEHARKTIEMPPKPGIHPSYENTFIHAMPAYLKRMNICGIKWVAGFPGNHYYNLPNISGLLILNDTQTGLPLAVMDCRWITTIRTALVSAIAARVCTKPIPEVLAIVGCGLQGRYHARTIIEALPTIKAIRFIDIFESSMRRFQEETAKFFAGELLLCQQEQDCIADADIIITCTPGDKPIVKNSWFKPGATGIGIEGGCAWEAEVLHSVDKFIVDDIPQAKHFETQGDFPGGMPAVYAELGDIIAEHKRGRELVQERILITPLGLAIEDIAIAKLIYETAIEHEVGIYLPLMREDL